MSDHRDGLILALSALPRAGRATREAFEAAIPAGIVEPETLKAIVGDPIPVITQDDLDMAEECAAPYLPTRRLEIA
jgi:hypothetical protein